MKKAQRVPKAPPMSPVTQKDIDDIVAWNKRGQALLARAVYSILIDIHDTLKEIKTQQEKQKNGAQYHPPAMD